MRSKNYSMLPDEKKGTFSHLWHKMWFNRHEKTYFLTSAITILAFGPVCNPQSRQQLLFFHLHRNILLLWNVRFKFTNLTVAKKYFTASMTNHTKFIILKFLFNSLNLALRFNVWITPFNPLTIEFNPRRVIQAIQKSSIWILNSECLDSILDIKLHCTKKHRIH